MSYDLYFLRRRPGQSWDSAVEAMEEVEPSEATELEVAIWDRLIPQVRELLGDVEIFEDPPAWEISHAATGLQVSWVEGQWALAVPYWTRGEKAGEVLQKVYGVAAIVARETGLEGYDPQLEKPISDVTDPSKNGAALFDQVARTFGQL